MIEYLFAFGIGIVASILSGIAGGGGGLIAAPFFILLGLPPAAAIATGKFGGVGVTLGTMVRLRNTPYVQREYLVPLLLITVVASVIGTFILLHTNEEVLRRLIGLMMLGSLPFLFFKKEAGLVRLSTNGLKRFIGYFLYFCVVVLQAAFSGGIGTVIPIIMIGLFGLTALEASATRRIPGLVGAALSLLLYMLSGIVDYGLGFSILVGSIIGGWIGQHIAIKQGESFVKWFLCVVIVVLSATLLF